MLIFPKEKLFQFAKSMLTAAGLSADDAATGAAVLIQSDLSGVDSHGLSRLPLYLSRIKANLVNVAAKVKIVSETATTLVVDCDNGMGIATMPGIMDLCLKKAKESGLAAATLRHSNHYGVGNYYALKSINEGMISIMTTNTTPCMAPTGGVDLLIGTNPITVAVPAARQKPIILDMATSNVAMGKLQAMFREKQKIPFGWAITKEGLPTDEPSEAVEGSLLPIAGYKGYGLAVMVDILSAVLAGASFGFDIGRLDRAKVPKPEGIGHFLLVIDPSRFLPLDEFKKRVDDYVLTMKESNKAKGVQEILLPGELELRKMEQRSQEGIPVTDALAALLLGLAKELKLAGPDDDFSSLINKAS